MIRCWSCGTEHESPAPYGGAGNRDVAAEIIDSYRLGYAKGREDGYSDAKNHYMNKCTLCGIEGTSSPWACTTCKEENPRWMGN